MSLTAPPKSTRIAPNIILQTSSDGPAIPYVHFWRQYKYRNGETIFLVDDEENYTKIQIKQLVLLKVLSLPTIHRGIFVDTF